MSREQAEIVMQGCSSRVSPEDAVLAASEVCVLNEGDVLGTAEGDGDVVAKVLEGLRTGSWLFSSRLCLP